MPNPLDSFVQTKASASLTSHTLTPANGDFYRAFRDRFEKEAPLASLDFQDAADWQLIQDQIALNLLELDRIQSQAGRRNPGPAPAGGLLVWLAYLGPLFCRGLLALLG